MAYIRSGPCTVVQLVTPIMKGLFLILAVIAFTCSYGTEAALTRGLRVKFNIGLGIGTDFFFDVPRTVLNAIFNGWSVTPGTPNPPYTNLTMLCYSDRILCAFFDASDNIAGLQIAHDQTEFSDYPFDWEKQGFSEWTPPVSIGQTSKTYWVTQLFFVSPDSASLKEPVNPTNDNVLRDNDLWVTGIDKEFYRIAGDEAGIENSTYKRQACIPWMGRHYFYNMTEETLCTSEGIFPWFVLVDSGLLEGVGLIVSGKLAQISNRRDWFERPGELAVKLIVPEGSQCLYDLAANVGFVTMHIYFTDQPWFIGCPLL